MHRANALAAHEGLKGRTRLGALQLRRKVLGFLVDTRKNVAAVATDEVAGDAKRLRRLLGKTGGKRQRLTFDGILGDDLPNQASFQRLAGRQRLAGGKQRKGPLVTHDARRDQAGRGFRHQRQIDEGRAELAAVGSDLNQRAMALSIRGSPPRAF